MSAPGSMVAEIRIDLESIFGKHGRGLNSARHNAHTALMSLGVPLCRFQGPHTQECDVATEALVVNRMVESLKGG